jgi:hypothetical protein
VQVRRHSRHKAWNIIINADSRIERAVSPKKIYDIQI